MSSRLVVSTVVLGLVMAAPAGCGDDPAGTARSAAVDEPAPAESTTTTAGAPSAPISLLTTTALPSSPTIPAEATVPTQARAPAASVGTGTALGRVVLNEADNGRRVRIDAGSQVQLRLNENGGWETPVVDGSSIELVPVNSFTGTGSFTWELARRRPGTTVVTVPGPSMETTFHLTVDVT